MAIVGERIRYGAHAAYLAKPERAVAPMPGIVVLQEAWGVDAHIEDVARRYAAAGYVALAPDLYAENGERPEPLSPPRLAALQAWANGLTGSMTDPAVREASLARIPEPERTRLAESFTAMWAHVTGIGALVPKVVAAAAWLRDENPLTRAQKIGSVGFCMGGGLSGTLACTDAKLGAAVVFYGMPPEPAVAANGTCPILGFYASTDARLNDKLPAFGEACKAAGRRFESHLYAGAAHAFFNDGRPTYHQGAARDAFARALGFFREHL